MKTNLTKEQSAKLIELGIPKEKASRSISKGGNTDIMRVERGYITKRGTSYPIFTLTDLLELLPKEKKQRNDHYTLSIDFYNTQTVVYYTDRNDAPIISYVRIELIDALYELAVWCIKNGYLNTESNGK